VLMRVKNDKERYQLFVIHIIQLELLEPSGNDWNLAPLFVEEILWHKKAKEVEGREFLTQLTTQLDQEEIPYTPILLRARNAKATIVDEISKRGIKILTVGRRGRSDLLPGADLRFMGSFSSFCTEHAPCSVHIVR